MPPSSLRKLASFRTLTLAIAVVAADPTLGRAQTGQPPTFDPTVSCEGNVQCVKLEKKALLNLRHIWARVPSHTRTECADEGRRSTPGGSYITTLDCIGQQSSPGSNQPSGNAAEHQP